MKKIIIGGLIATVLVMPLTCLAVSNIVDIVNKFIYVANLFLQVALAIAVIFIIIAGFKWMTAGGEEDKISEARKYLLYGAIGIAIIVLAWTIVSYIIPQFLDMEPIT